MHDNKDEPKSSQSKASPLKNINKTPQTQIRRLGRSTIIDDLEADKEVVKRRKTRSTSRITFDESPKKKSRSRKSSVSELEPAKRGRSKNSSIVSRSRSKTPTAEKQTIEETPKKRGKQRKVVSTTEIHAKDKKSDSLVMHSEPGMKARRSARLAETPVSTKSRITIERKKTSKRALEKDFEEMRVSPAKIKKLEKRSENLRKQLGIVEKILEEYYHPDEKLRRSERIRAYMIRRLRNESESLSELIGLIEKQSHFLAHIK